MRVFLVVLCVSAVTLSTGVRAKKSSSSVLNSNSNVNGYSQPIPVNYGGGVAPLPPQQPQQSYPYQPLMAAGSTHTDYYQSMDNAVYGGQNYARHQLPTASGAAPTYYEPLPHGSGHQGGVGVGGGGAGHYPIKRGYGWGGGYGGGGGEIDKLAIIIPLIIIPLLLCWPLFIYSAQHHHHPIVYAAPGWKRSGDGKAPTVKESRDKKVEELTDKVLPKLKD